MSVFDRPDRLALAITFALGGAAFAGDDVPRGIPTPASVGWRNMGWKYRGPWLAEGSRFRLASCPAVQEELGLEDSAREAILRGRLPQLEKEYTELWYQRSRYTVPGREQQLDALQARMLEIERTLDQSIIGLLNADQRERLDQIALQQAGPLVVVEPRIARRIHLRADQIEEIRSFLVEAEARNKAVYEARYGNPPPLSKFDGPLSQDQRDEIAAWEERSNARSRIAKDSESMAIGATRRVLTAAQKNAFNRMLGRPFDVSKLSTAYWDSVRAREAQPGGKPDRGRDPSSTPAIKRP